VFSADILVIHFCRLMRFAEKLGFDYAWICYNCIYYYKVCEYLDDNHCR